MGITEILIRQAEDRVQQAEKALSEGLSQAQLQAQLQAELQARLQAQLAEESAREERKNMVSNMRRHNFSAARIADITGYALDEVKTFFKELDSRK